MLQAEIERLRLEIQGAVQGVGFRPFVFRLARELQVAGWVRNDPHGVFIEIEGRRPTLERFLERLPAEIPPRAQLHRLQPTWLAAEGFDGFTIRTSRSSARPTAVVLPDLATCPECLAEVMDPDDRRHRYPFTNCTHCGPRFTIVRRLPYDRPHTTMADFHLCPECRREYEDPLDRRFHAQPNACRSCGPRLALWDAAGEGRAEGDQALTAAAEALGEGAVVAVKGVGGFHLMVDAGNHAAVGELRRRKARGDKPFAVMVRDLAMARQECLVSEDAGRLLTSPEGPIVLLPRRPEAGSVVTTVAPGNPHLGVLLPTAPLHHLLLAAVDRPLVATSGNRSDEPIAIDNLEAVRRLDRLADLFLVHDRPIARPVDDSVVRFMAGRPRLLRRARGYAPLPVRLPEAGPTVLAVGGQLKNTIALAVGDQVFLSQHLGDMDSPTALEACERVMGDFLDLYDAEPVVLAHDLHPDYASTGLARRWARRLGGGRPRSRRDPWERLLGGPGVAEERGAPAAEEGRVPTLGVQHHHAHLASCLADNGLGLDDVALGAIWDGTGYGPDGTVWGGELLLGSAAGYRRVAHLAPFLLPGGDAAVVEPRRAALALLWQAYGERALERARAAGAATAQAFASSEQRLLMAMLRKGFSAPWTSSAGRLFDAVASLLGLCQVSDFEGQAAMALEHAVEPGEDGAYPLQLERGVEEEWWNRDREPPWVLDWAPLVAALLEDLERGESLGVMAARVHRGLARGVAQAVTTILGDGEVRRVALSGGCFQNRILTETLQDLLQEAGYQVLLHRRVPANDGGLSLGQAAVAAARLRSTRHPEAATDWQNGG